ncbi:MAG: sulfotransferase family 2 domain-containing protein [Pseudomonadota bacterium]
MRTITGQRTRLDRKSASLQALYRSLNKIPFLPSTRCYNITISHEHKFLWYRVAKVGTRTILHHLKESEVVLDVEHAGWLYYPVNSYKGYFKFAFVRNPWDRLASTWINKVVRKNTLKFSEADHQKMQRFENFVGFVSDLNIEDCDRHIRSQSALIDLNTLDYLGRMETFDRDARYIFDKLKLKKADIVPRNVTSERKAYRDYYDDRLVEEVAQIYRKDIQILGYTF